MTAKEIQQFKSQITTFRNGLDAMLEKLDALQATSNEPRKRRNLKAERVQNHASNFILGTWKKPKNLKKAS
jgi:hypothetical protein